MDCLLLYILTGAEMVLLFLIDDKDGEGEKDNILLFNHQPQTEYITGEKSPIGCLQSKNNTAK